MLFPMWTYNQSNGNLSRGGALAGAGYSGAEPNGKNNPAMQNVPDVGPIPQGTYTIDQPFDSTTHGPYALALVPSSENQMFGRRGFLMHGDSSEHLGAASEGCIIMARHIREIVWESGDHELQVV